MPQIEVANKLLEKVKTGTVKGLLIYGSPDQGILQTVKGMLPSSSVFPLEQLHDIHDLFLFLMLNREKAIIIDAGDFFEEADPRLSHRVVSMIKSAISGDHVHNFTSRTKFRFEGAVVMIGHTRKHIPAMIANRMYVC